MAALSPAQEGEDPLISEVKYPRGIWFLWGAVIFVLLGALSLLFLPSRLIDVWIPGAALSQRGELLPAAAQAVLFALGGVIAVVGVALSLARHGSELRSAERETRLLELQMESHEFEKSRERDRQRAEEDKRLQEVRRELRERFVNSTSLLAHESPSTRKAGLFSLATLADDWASQPEGALEAQAAIDVMCGYLRSPVPTEKRSEELDVRNTGLSLLRGRCRAPHPGGRSKWEGIKLDFSNAVIDFPLPLSDLNLSEGSILDFSGSTFKEQFTNLGSMTLRDTSRVDFSHAVFEKARVYLNRSVLQDESTVNWTMARAKQHTAITIDHLKCVGASDFSMLYVVADDAKVAFEHLECYDRASVDLRGSLFKGRSKLSFFNSSLHHKSEVVLTGLSFKVGSEFRIDDETLEAAQDQPTEFWDSFIEERFDNGVSLGDTRLPTTSDLTD